MRGFEARYYNQAGAGPSDSHRLTTELEDWCCAGTGGAAVEAPEEETVQAAVQSMSAPELVKIY